MRQKHLDVRPILEQGGEPYSVIRKAVDSLAPEEALVLRAPFLPSPLIEKLQSEGFQSRVERGADGSWTIYFSRRAS